MSKWKDDSAYILVVSENPSSNHVGVSLNDLWLLLQLVAVFLDERSQTVLPSEYEGKALKLLHHCL